MSKHVVKSPQGDAVEQASAWCLRLAEGSLSPDEQAQFDAWLERDAENALAFDDAAHAWQALEQARLEPELIAMRSSALGSFRRGNASRWQARGSFRRRIVAMAACLLIAVMGAGLSVMFVPHAYETGLGERRIVVLDDGSRVSLDAESRVEVRYSRDRRELWLEKGRAKFQVAREPLRPFSVNAADKVVVATGTEFSVELLASEVHVILYEGSVEVLNDQPRAGPPQPVRMAQQAEAPSRVSAVKKLVPGRELIAKVSAVDARVKPADPVRSLAWESGQLAFNDESLAQAVERMNRYARTPLVIADPMAGQIRISGVFVAGDTDAFIEGVTGVFPVRVATDDKGRKSLSSTR